MSRKKPVRRLLVLFAAALTAIGVLFFLFVTGYSFSVAEKIIGYVTAAAIVLISAVLWYKIYMWIEADSDDAWRAFGTLPKEAVDIIENALLECGEDVISRKIQYLNATYEEDPGRYRAFFVDKKEYLQGFMLAYVKTNIEKF